MYLFFFYIYLFFVYVVVATFNNAGCVILNEDGPFKATFTCNLYIEMVPRRSTGHMQYNILHNSNGYGSLSTLLFTDCRVISLLVCFTQLLLLPSKDF